jgi:hypothetical protein
VLAFIDRSLGFQRDIGELSSCNAARALERGAGSLKSGAHDDYPCSRWLYPGKIRNQYYPDENSASGRSLSADRSSATYTGAYLALTGEAAAHISCRNEMMQRAALCATLLLESW